MDKAIILVCKQMEPGGTVPQEGEAGEAGNVDEVSSFENDVVRGCAHGKGGTFGQSLINGELAVEEVVQVLGKAEDAALEVGAACAAGEVDIAPIAAVDVFVGVDHQLQSGGLIIAVPIRVVQILTQAVFVQIYGCNGIQRNGHIDDGGAVLIVNVRSVKADGNINIVCACGKDSGRQQTQHHHKGEDHADRFFHTESSFRFLGCFSPADSSALGQGPRYALIWAQVALSKSFLVGIRPSSVHF